MIALNLTRLYTWLVQMNAAGQTVAPRDIAHMVASTDALVHAFIRSRAMAQLEAAGYFQAARAMRVPPSMRASPLDMPQLAIVPSEAEQFPPSDFLSRVETVIDQFEQADIIGSILARIIVCTLLYVSPEAQSTPAFVPVRMQSAIRIRWVAVRPPTPHPVGRGPPYIFTTESLCAPHPTGCRASARPIGAVSEANRREINGTHPGSPPGTAGDIRHRHITSSPGARPRIRDPGWRLKYERNLRFSSAASADPRLDLGSTPPIVKHLMSQRQGHQFSLVSTVGKSVARSQFAGFTSTARPEVS